MGNEGNDSDFGNNEALTPEPMTSFPDLFAVLSFLKKEGFRCSRTTLYRHRGEGKIRLSRDGTFQIRAVQRYAAHFCKRIGEETISSSKLNSLQEQKLKAEIDKLQSQGKIAAIKAEVATGAYIERAQHEFELAKRAAFLKGDLENFFRSRAGEIIQIVNGDPGKISDLIERGCDLVEDWLDRYSAVGMQFTIDIDPALSKTDDKEEDSDEEEGVDI